MLANRIKDRLYISISKEDKEFVKSKAERLGFNSTSAFLIESAKNDFRLNIDMNVYRKLTNEINYIGKNINSLTRKVNTLGAYSDNDIDFLKTNQKIIIDLMNKEYDRLLDLKMNFTSESLNLKEKENLIKALEEIKLTFLKK